MVGGYEITITDIEKFPRYNVCILLLDATFEVWMVKSGWFLYDNHVKNCARLDRIMYDMSLII